MTAAAMPPAPLRADGAERFMAYSQFFRCGGAFSAFLRSRASAPPAGRHQPGSRGLISGGSTSTSTASPSATVRLRARAPSRPPRQSFAECRQEAGSGLLHALAGIGLRRSPRGSTAPILRMPPAARGKRTPATSRLARRTVQGEGCMPNLCQRRLPGLARQHRDLPARILGALEIALETRSDRDAAFCARLHRRAPPVPSRNPNQSTGWRKRRHLGPRLAFSISSRSAAASAASPAVIICAIFRRSISVGRLAREGATFRGRTGSRHR